MKLYISDYFCLSMLDRKAHSVTDEYMGNERVPLAISDPVAIINGYETSGFEGAMHNNLNYEKFQNILGVSLYPLKEEIKLVRGVSLLVGYTQTDRSVEWWLI